MGAPTAAGADQAVVNRRARGGDRERKPGRAPSGADTGTRERRQYESNDRGRRGEEQAPFGRIGAVMRRPRHAERAILAAVLVLGCVPVVPGHGDHRVRMMRDRDPFPRRAVPRAAIANSKRTVCATTARTASQTTASRGTFGLPVPPHRRSDLAIMAGDNPALIEGPQVPEGLARARRTYSAPRGRRSRFSSRSSRALGSFRRRA